MMALFILLILSFVILVLGTELLISSAASLGLKYKLSPFIIGVGLVSLITSAPEFFISLKALFLGRPEVSFSNIIGSNIFNLLIVLGTCFFFIAQTKLKTPKEQLMLFGVLALQALVLALTLLFPQAALPFYVFMISLVIIPLHYIFKNKKEGLSEEAWHSYPLTIDLLALLAGGTLLHIGSSFCLKFSLNLVQELNLDFRFSGLFLTAMGTSLPELAASIIAYLKKEGSIGLGNVLGSCLFNTGLILAPLGLFGSNYVSLSGSAANTHLQDIGVYILSLLLLTAMFYIFRKIKIPFGIGLIPLGVYFGYLYVVL